MTRLRKTRPFDRTMIIVCEDTKTAPIYLSYLRTKAIAMSCWDYIEILPKPLIEDETNLTTNNSHKTSRKKRQFEAIDAENWIDIEVEVANREQPVIYVRTVQKALEEGSYLQGWAVFDLDGHTGHERAALMAAKNPTVNIAFSSRSIETWFLLHFGQYGTAFQKVHCKDLRGRELSCNASNPCFDSECLLGYIRRNTPLSNYKKKDDISAIVEPLTRIAIINSQWLRKKYDSNQWYYLRNPYTTMDFLIKSLYKWINLGEAITINGFHITINKLTPTIEIAMKNISKTRQVVQKQHFSFENNTIEYEIEANGIFEVNESRVVKITNFVKTESTMLKYPSDSERDFIWILC